MVNVENPDYQMCIDNNYLVKDSHGQVRPLQWWHGYGGLLDYTNPAAVEWLVLLIILLLLLYYYYYYYKVA